MFSFQHVIFEIYNMFYTDNTSHFILTIFQLFTGHLWLVVSLLDNTDIGFDPLFTEFYYSEWLGRHFSFKKCPDSIYVFKRSGLGLTENTPEGSKSRNDYSDLDKEWWWLRGYQWMSYMLGSLILLKIEHMGWIAFGMWMGFKSVPKTLAWIIGSMNWHQLRWQRPLVGWGR